MFRATGTASAAKRMSMLHNNVVKECENRFGALYIEMPGGGEKK